ncbi:MAG: helix-turn-helix transcriptional regulator [Clostridia bacterium]|nr:helix-turn-helix transcriptional regulator [Clostridia bacterium]
MSDEKSRYKRVSGNISVRHSADSTPFVAPPHLHGYYEIYYNIRGAKGFMANCDFYNCDERDLIIIPKLQAHKVIVKKGCEYERCIINIDEYAVNLIEILSQSSDSMSWIKEDRPRHPYKVKLTPLQHEKYIGLIMSYIEAEKTGGSLDALSVFVKIMSFLKDCFENPTKAEYMDEKAISYTDRIIKYIEKDFRNATVADISSKLYSNRDHLNRMFKDETGITMSKYLIMRKLAEAQKNLYLGKSVKEACFLSGFNDYANFLRTFKKYEGYTPGEFEFDENEILNTTEPRQN